MNGDWKLMDDVRRFCIQTFITFYHYPEEVPLLDSTACATFIIILSCYPASIAIVVP